MVVPHNASRVKISNYLPAMVSEYAMINQYTVTILWDCRLPGSSNSQAVGFTDKLIMDFQRYVFIQKDGT